ncbi:MAG: ABC transporter ATP-binding protein/permease [Planctomycetes bacterium]|nr:ABC transporter ATP-binding protein/permease [Planctomycetota bacterium]
MSSGRGSRRLYREYLETLRERKRKAKIDPVSISWHGSERSLRRNRSFGQLFRSFLGELRPHRASLLFTMGTIALGAGLTLIPPAATKLAIDNVFIGAPLPAWIDRIIPHTVTGDRTALLGWIAVGILVVSVFGTAISISGRWQATRITKRLQVHIRRKTFEHAVHLPLHRVWQMKSGGIASLLREDAGGVAELVFNMLYNPFRAIVQLVGILTILTITDFRLLLGAGLLLPIVWLSHRTWIGRIRPLYRDIRQQRTDVDSHATEAFGGMRVVRAFAREQSETSRFLRGSHLMARQEILTWWWSRGIELAWALLIPTASALLLWYGGRQVIAGSLTPGDLVLFLTYLAMLLGPLEALASSATNFQTNLAGYDRTLDVLNETPELPDRPGAQRLDRRAMAGAMRVENLEFTYPNSKVPVICGVSFDVSPGETVAFVGASGAGKTTLCNLIARFFDPTGGRILVDGVDLRDIRLHDWRSLLGIVEQDVFLFDGTIADNIAYGRKHASTEDIERAAMLACCHGFIHEMPKKYLTRIGERGVRLSGGQRQRIAIARAVLADPRILILDEATSNLDVESELFIQEGLVNLMRHRTSFVIAHRLSTIRNAHKIVVLKGGAVAEIGSHEELMARGGSYSEMVLIQTARTEVKKIEPAAPAAVVSSS